MSTNPLLTIFSKFDNVQFAQTYVHDLSVRPYEVVNFIGQCMNALIHMKKVTDPKSSLIGFMIAETKIIVVRVSRDIESKITIQEIKHMLSNRIKLNKLTVLSTTNYSSDSTIALRELHSSIEFDEFTSCVLRYNFDEDDIVNIYATKPNV
jgi:hypothetical protein